VHIWQQLRGQALDETAVIATSFQSGGRSLLIAGISAWL
jgi:hypothetical protein